MRFIIRKADNILSALLVIIGVGAIVLAFFVSPLQEQIAIGLVGLGFISLCLVQMKRARDSRAYTEELERINTKLDEIKKEIEKAEKPGGTGIAIADVISSGIKYYTEHLNKDNKEE
jgi:hypothetical protein